MPHPLQQPTPASNRLYAAEGSVHLYSSAPVVLTPADLYDLKQNTQLKEFTELCNIYVVAARGRIFVDPLQFHFTDDVMRGRFIVAGESGPNHVDFVWRISGDPFGDGSKVEEVRVSDNGTHVQLFNGAGSHTVAPALRLVAEARSGLTQAQRDLEVLYVGQGIGRSRARTALDRLQNHSTLQRILADAVTLMPNMEVVLLLYRFEHSRSIISTGGDLRAEPAATQEQEQAHMRRISGAKISRRSRIALAEAALIRHFQPHYNVQIKSSDFAARRKLKVLAEVLKLDLTGVIVEISSANIRSRLQTASAPPVDLSTLFGPEVLSGDPLDDPHLESAWQDQVQQMAHTQFANFALTTPEERDTFMHGTVWHGSRERSAGIF